MFPTDKIPDSCRSWVCSLLQVASQELNLSHFCWWLMVLIGVLTFIFTSQQPEPSLDKRGFHCHLVPLTVVQTLRSNSARQGNSFLSKAISFQKLHERQKLPVWQEPGEKESVPFSFPLDKSQCLFPSIVTAFFRPISGSTINVQQSRGFTTVLCELARNATDAVPARPGGNQASLVRGHRRED